MEAQSARMLREMKRRKMTTVDFQKMYITSPHRRLTDLKNKGIEIQSEFIERNGKRFKQYWIARKRLNFYRVKPKIDGLQYEVEKSKFTQTRLNKLGVK